MFLFSVQTGSWAVHKTWLRQLYFVVSEWLGYSVRAVLPLRRQVVRIGTNDVCGRC
jgi:hypothetical protein